MSQNQPLLELRNIRRFYPNGDSLVRALDDVSFQVWPGEFVAIVGQSGSGKSTLMNLIGCLDRADDGDYYVLGQSVADHDADQLAALRRESFGFVFQRYNLLNSATAAENVEIPALYAGIAKPQRERRAMQLLSNLGLEQRSDHRPMQLSGGQQQRVAIARAEVIELFKKLNEEQRITVILVTHDQNIARNARRNIVLRDGSVLCDTTNHDEAAQAIRQEVRG